MKKAMLKRCIIITLILILCCLPASATENGVNVYYDEATDRMVVSGNIPEAAYNQLVSLVIYSDNDESATYTSGDTLQYFTTVETGSAGEFLYSFKMADMVDPTQEADSGFYVARIGAVKLTTAKEESFFYMSNTERGTFLISINQATTKGGIDSIISTKYVILGVDITDYNAIVDDDKTNLLTKVLSKRPAAGFASVGVFADTVKEMMGCDALKKASTSLELTDAIAKYDSQFKLNTAPMYTEFSQLGTTEQTSVYTRLGGITYADAEAVREQFDAAVVLSLLNQSNQWGEFKDVLDNYANYLSIDLTYYNKCNKENLAIALSDGTYNTTKELYDAIKTFAEANSGGDSGSGGGSGSGSGSGGGFSYNITEPASSVPRQGTAVNLNNNEMKDFEWAKASVEGLMEMGAVSGNESGLFLPASEITREEFLKILVVAFSLYKSGSHCEFDDVPKDNWAYSYIASAVEKGIVNGVGENSFGYGQKIIRQDMAVMVDRAAKIAQIEILSKTQKSFTDVDDVSLYAQNSIQTLGNAGIINGYEDGSFRPKAAVIRAEAAVLIFNVVKGD